MSPPGSKHAVRGAEEEAGLGAETRMVVLNRALSAPPRATRVAAVVRTLLLLAGSMNSSERKAKSSWKLPGVAREEMRTLHEAPANCGLSRRALTAAGSSLGHRAEAKRGRGEENRTNRTNRNRTGTGAVAMAM
jgi:hypothetical protein